jgi:Dihydroorotase and related cyclic amidohydrolases
MLRMGFDLVIRGATVVTPGHREAADIGIADGRIAQLGGTMAGAQELAAGGLLAIPGGVDAHTHLVHQGLGDRLGFPIWVDDFWSGSRAAIAGGITTIGNMTYPVPDDDGTEETPAPRSPGRWPAPRLRPRSTGSFTRSSSTPPRCQKAKSRPSPTRAREHQDVPVRPGPRGRRARPARGGQRRRRRLGDAAALRGRRDAQAGEKLIAEGRGAVANFPDARPVAAEVAAVDQAIGIARRTGARVYIVHLSSAAALDRCRRARAAGLPVYVETRPLYLHLTRERFAEPDAAKYAGAPPLREAADRDALWAGLAAGDVDTLCSDHAPWTLDAKLDPALNAVTARQGVADLETLMPMLYSEGVAAGRISLDQFVALTSANAARIFGLHPRKGRSPPAPTRTSRCGTRCTAARSTARACNRFPAIRFTTAGRCRAGPGSSSAAASSYSLTARSRPAPVMVNGFVVESKSWRIAILLMTSIVSRLTRPAVESVQRA